MLGKWLKAKNPRVMLTSFSLVAAVTVILFLTIDDKDTFLSITLGSFLGFLGAVILYRFGLFLVNEEKDLTEESNTKYIYKLYASELQMNQGLINELIKHDFVPYYRIKTITRDKLWGEIANYSKDIYLMKKLNVLYGEFELINNKVELMNKARMENISKPKHDKSNDLMNEIAQQKKGAIGLGKNALVLIGEILEIITPSGK